MRIHERARRAAPHISKHNPSPGSLVLTSTLLLDTGYIQGTRRTSRRDPRAHRAVLGRGREFAARGPGGVGADTSSRRVSRRTSRLWPAPRCSAATRSYCRVPRRAVRRAWWSTWLNGRVTGSCASTTTSTPTCRSTSGLTSQTQTVRRVSFRFSFGFGFGLVFVSPVKPVFVRLLFVTHAPQYRGRTRAGR